MTPSSVRSGINPSFAMSLLTELEKLKGSASYKYFTPSGADDILCSVAFGLEWDCA